MKKQLFCSFMCGFSLGGLAFIKIVRKYYEDISEKEMEEAMEYFRNKYSVKETTVQNIIPPLEEKESYMDSIQETIDDIIDDNEYMTTDPDGDEVVRPRITVNGEEYIILEDDTDICENPYSITE